jgi:hypothetical protein
VQLKGQAVIPDGCTLESVPFARLDPGLAGLRDRNAVAGWRVNAVADLHLDGSVAGVGILLAVERLGAPLATLVRVIYEPGLQGLTGCVLPLLPS